MAENDNRSAPFSSDYLSELIKAVTANAPSNRESPPDKSAEGSPAIGDVISALTSDPELISKLPSLIAAAKPIIEMLGAQGRSASPRSNEGAVPAAALLKNPPTKVTPEGDSRAALLCAMKPYLSADRRQAIDYIVKLGRLGDILKTL